MQQALRAALHLFRTQKVRFMLTVSGIMVGVGSLVVMASLLEVGQGVLRQTSSAALGDDVITVHNDWGALMNNPEAERLTRRDQEAIERSTLLPEGTTVTGAYGIRDRKATWKEEDFNPLTVGVEPTAFEVYGLSVERGRGFVEDDFVNGRRVVIAGPNILDGRLTPGDEVRVEGTPFRVVGIMKAKPEVGPGDFWGWNNRLLFPASTYRLVLDPSRRPSNIVVKVAVPPTYQGLIKDYIKATRGVLDAILAQERTVKSWEFEGSGDDESTEALILRTIEALLYLTTFFSMMVGGINIMNIMLVTVAERTREIGLRRAVGASRRDILQQFVVETLVVTLIGAVLGLLGALFVVAAGSAAMNEWVTEWPFRLVPWSIGLGLASSTFIGFVFGLYPAWRAARLDPVEALRFE